MAHSRDVSRTTRLRERFDGMGLRARLVAGFTVLIVPTLAADASSVLSHRRVPQALATYRHHDNRIADPADDARAGLLRARRNEKGFLLRVRAAVASMLLGLPRCSTSAATSTARCARGWTSPRGWPRATSRRGCRRTDLEALLAAGRRLALPGAHPAPANEAVAEATMTPAARGAARGRARAARRLPKAGRVQPIPDNDMNSRTVLAAVFAAALAGAQLPAAAAADASQPIITKQEAKDLKTQSKGEYEARKDIAEANHDLNKADCEVNASGSAERACKKEANALRKAEKAEAKQIHESDKDAIKALSK